MQKLLAIKGMVIGSVMTALAACGASDGGSGDDRIAINLATTQDIAVTTARLASEIGQPPTAIDIDDVPADGDATYYGLLLFLDGDAAFTGQTEIETDFSTSLVTGTATDFVYSDGNESASDALLPLAGSLAMANGEIDRDVDGTDDQIIGDFAGLLSSADPSGPGEVDVALDLTGRFVQGGIIGELDGTITPTAGSASPVAGSIIAVED